MSSNLNNNNMDPDSDSDEEFVGQDEDEQVDLGFCERVEDATASVLHELSDWSHWDGGKVGGKPIWMNPTTIPSKKELECTVCKKPMAFLLQIYCPLDDQDDAFHRSIYVFCCKDGNCIQENSFKVFRCQLARDNELYPYEAIETKIDNKFPHSICALCAQRATYSCSSCRVAMYCCQEHQKDHWKHGHKLDCESSSKSGKLVESVTSLEKMFMDGTLCTFPVYDVFIENEPNVNEAANDQEKEMIEQFNSQNLQDRKENEGEEKDLDEQDIIDISQKEINELLGSAKNQDKRYVEFMSRTSLAKSQIIRYARWGNGKPLWVHSEDLLTNGDERIPKCETCGTAREFEFQIMPQLLYYLAVNRNSTLESLQNKSTFDWGTVAIYTCPNSCEKQSEKGRYIQEFAWKQGPYEDSEQPRETISPEEPLNENL